MIYRREEYIEQAKETSRFPVRHIEALIDIATNKATYVGQVTLGLQTPVGVQQMPVSFEIEADSIEQAFERFEATAEPKVEEARKSIEEEITRLRREQSGRIIRPDEIGGLGGAPGAGGTPGGGIIGHLRRPSR